jgi:diguanylate cyclase (GGDEF)-like protein
LITLGTYPWLTTASRPVAFVVISLPVIPAVLVGVYRTPAVDRSAGWLLLAAMLCLNTGTIIWYFVSNTGVIGAYWNTLGMVFLLCAALVLVVRRGRNDVGGLVDAVVVSMVGGALVWNFLIEPRMQAAHAILSAQVTLCVAFFALAGILGAMVRLLHTARAFIPALWFLTAALAFSLIGNIGVGLSGDSLIANHHPRWTDMAIIAAYAAVGLCGLHPSAGTLLRPGPAPADRLSSGRLVFLGIALAAVPLLSGLRELTGGQTNGVMPTVSTLAVTPLVMIRIGALYGQRARAEQALRHQAAHDALTGLPNRRELEFQLCRTTQAGRHLAVLFCDLNKFKQINDRLGHLAGDRVLVEVSERLRRCVRADDTLCRYGGDEFLILCPSADASAAEALRGRIMAALDPPIQLPGGPVTISASVGMFLTDGADDAEDLIRSADAAMYEVKRGQAA